MKMWDTNVNLYGLAWQRSQDPEKYIKALVAAGYGACGRYLRRKKEDPTCLSPNEAALYHMHGIKIVLIFQHRSNDVALFTAANGKIDGEAALARLQELGVPPNAGKMVFFAFDADVMKSQVNKVTDYMVEAGRPLKKAGFMVGVYGDSEVITHCLTTAHPDEGMGDLADGGYLTNAKAWSGDKTIFQSNDPRVLVKQASLPKAPYPNAPFQVDDCVVDDNLVETFAW